MLHVTIRRNILQWTTEGVAECRSNGGPGCAHRARAEKPTGDSNARPPASGLPDVTLNPHLWAAAQRCGTLKTFSLAKGRPPAQPEHLRSRFLGYIGEVHTDTVATRTR